MPLTSTFSTIAATQTAADKPLDTTLMDAMRQDIDVLYEWMGGPTYTPSTSHDHDGVNSRAVKSGLVFLASATASASATIDFTSGLSTLYEDYEFHIFNALPATDNDDLYLRVGTGVGPTYQTASYFWSAMAVDSTATEYNVAGENAAFVSLSGGGLVLNTAGEIGYNGVVRCFNPMSATVKKAFSYSGTLYGGNPDRLYTVRGGGAWQSTSAVTAFRFLYSLGNVTSGRFFMYGVQKL